MVSVRSGAHSGVARAASMADRQMCGSGALTRRAALAAAAEWLPLLSGGRCFRRNRVR